MQWVSLQCAIVVHVFPDHTDLLFARHFVLAVYQNLSRQVHFTSSRGSRQRMVTTQWLCGTTSQEEVDLRVLQFGRLGFVHFLCTFCN